MSDHMTNDFKDKSNSGVPVLVRMVLFTIPLTVTGMIGLEVVSVMQSVTTATAEVGAETANTVVDLVPMVLAVFTVVIILNVVAGAARPTPTYSLSTENTLQDDIEEAQQRYMDNEITEFRLEAEVEQAFEKHDEESSPSRLDEELMYDRIDEETADLLMKMENA